jgi:hypothetical protein
VHPGTLRKGFGIRALFLAEANPVVRRGGPVCPPELPSAKALAKSHGANRGIRVEKVHFTPSEILKNRLKLLPPAQFSPPFVWKNKQTTIRKNKNAIQKNVLLPVAGASAHAICSTPSADATPAGECGFVAVCASGRAVLIVAWNSVFNRGGGGHSRRQNRGRARRLYGGGKNKLRRRRRRESQNQ